MSPEMSELIEALESVLIAEAARHYMRLAPYFPQPDVRAAVSEKARDAWGYFHILIKELHFDQVEPTQPRLSLMQVMDRLALDGRSN